MTHNTQPLWFLFHNKQLLLLPDEKGEKALPRGETRPFSLHDPDAHIHALGAHKGAPCYACALRTLPPAA